MEENKRPDIRPGWSAAEKILQPVCLILVIVTTVVLLAGYAKLPSVIPIHFTFAGKADATGGKGSLISLFIMQLVIYALLTTVERFPKIFNFPFEITKSNAAYEYGAARELLVVVKAEIMAAFSYLTLQSLLTKDNGASGLGEWFTAAFLGALALTTIFYIRRMLRHRNDNVYKNF